MNNKDLHIEYGKWELTWRKKINKQFIKSIKRRECESSYRLELELKLHSLCKARRDMAKKAYEYICT